MKNALSLPAVIISFEKYMCCGCEVSSFAGFSASGSSQHLQACVKITGMAHDVIRISYMYELALSTLPCVKARIATEAGYIARSYTRVLQRSLLLTCWMPVTSSSHIAAETPQCTGSSQVLPRYYCDHHKVTPSTSLAASWQV